MSLSSFLGDTVGKFWHESFSSTSIYLSMLKPAYKKTIKMNITNNNLQQKIIYL